VAAGWVWFTRPKEMRLVSAVTPTVPGLPVLHSISLRPYDNRFALFCRETIPKTMAYQECSVAMCRWNGELLWKVDLPRPKFLSVSNRLNYDLHGSHSQLSPDGRHLAQAVVDGSSQQIVNWLDGHRTGAVRLPCYRKMARLLVQDTGRIYAWIPSQPTWSFYIIEGNRIIARGTMPIPTSAVAGSCEGAFSPDGNAFVLTDFPGFTYYRVSISGSTLNLTRTYIANDPIDFLQSPLIWDSKLLLTSNGAIYNDRGQVTKANKWRFGDADTTVAVAVMQYLPGDNALVEGPIRIFDPRTHRHWSPNGGWAYIISKASADGRFALVGRQPGGRFQPLIAKLAGEKITSSSLERRLQRFTDPLEVDMVLYERPGRARAKLHAFIDKRYAGLPLPTIHNDGRTYDISQIVISKDGRTIRFDSFDVENDGQRKIFTYTW